MAQNDWPREAKTSSAMATLRERCTETGQRQYEADWTRLTFVADEDSWRLDYRAPHNRLLPWVNLPRRTKGLCLENVTPFPDGPRRRPKSSAAPAAILSDYGVTYPVLTSGPACPPLPSRPGESHPEP